MYWDREYRWTGGQTVYTGTQRGIGLVILGQRGQVNWLHGDRKLWGKNSKIQRNRKGPFETRQKRNGPTGSGSGHEADDDGQTEAGDMRRYRGRSPQPHIQPVLPHPQAFSHRAVLHIRRHTAGPGARRTHQRATERRERLPAGLERRTGPQEAPWLVTPGPGSVRRYQSS